MQVEHDINQEFTGPAGTSYEGEILSAESQRILRESGGSWEYVIHIESDMPYIKLIFSETDVYLPSDKDTDAKVLGFMLGRASILVRYADSDSRELH